MCEAQSPPTPGSPVFMTLAPEHPVPQLGESFTVPWGDYDVSYRVDCLRGPGKLTGRERLDCTVLEVKLR